MTTSMDSANFYKDLQEVLEKDFPITFKEIENGRLNVDWTYLISPEVVEIPTAVRDEMKNAIQSLFHFYSVTSITKSPVPNSSYPPLQAVIFTIVSNAPHISLAARTASSSVS